MEKNIGFGGASAHSSAPLPTAPPSYEEAIASAGEPMRPPVTSPPYPLGAASVPIPMPYNQPPNQTTMPTPSAYPGTSQSTSQPRFNATETNSLPQPEVRVIHQHVAYALGPNPVKMSCPTCHADIKTTTISDHQPSAHICCIVLCLLGCCLCSCLPFCMSAFMSVHHFCPNCKNYIGTWKG
ncbi:hypothetical protein DMN91_006353 [Ooceraea biroi]|uniref:Lipopolysaccharide-induced tumor necrosis factor-alpha factor-like protein n=1 Tax=Ooceraea biroi TaxID=2015173 RepID=A0A026X0P8_OOCBI|nr:lipopolysaccharide-induced tumor necrosis factor-alpha factor homolog [Ooceraea biroi]XP_011341014.1 lipopolysaccharide-induced tumor necrosis factor-alpha factor homolog [Ooceraea biroi]EZA61862.1 Lipopolysaccharide-induced tumor necrosis factor-alpha factor-like protein [Ooceraea biroi]RLU21974.1 hypothetical protein DMN91_006353 [Ooceraea biroi]